jgi:hypothetical protein
LKGIDPLFEFPKDKTETEKEARKKKLNDLKKALKAKRDMAVAEVQKAYELFRCSVVDKAQTQWDTLVNEMHTKNPWVGVNGKSNKGIHVKSWILFMDYIELYKLTVFPADADQEAPASHSASICVTHRELE